MKTKDILKKLAFILLFLVIAFVAIIGYIQWKEDNEKISCGGIAGLGCPSGYYCKIVTYANGVSRWDAGGICKKIDSNKTADCLSTKDTGVTCWEY